MVRFLKQVEAGEAVKELGRKQGFGDASFCKWRTRFREIDVTDVRRLHELEGENGKLKKPLDEAMLDIEALKVIAREKRQARRRGAKRCRRSGRRPGYLSVRRAG